MRVSDAGLSASSSLHGQPQSTLPHAQLWWHWRHAFLCLFCMLKVIDSAADWLHPGVTTAACAVLVCSFLQRLDDFWSWAQLGFLACPAALQGVNAQSLLAAMLRHTFLLPVYGGVMLPLHSMYQQHVTPALEQLVSVLLENASRATRQQQVQDARQLVTKCYHAAVDGAEAEHAARRRYICKVLQDLLACVEVSAAGCAVGERAL